MIGLLERGSTVSATRCAGAPLLRLVCWLATGLAPLQRLVRGTPLSRARSNRLQVRCRFFPGPPVSLDLIRDLHSFSEPHPRSLDGADMDEDILAALIGLDKAIPLRLVEPLHSTRSHSILLACFSVPLATTSLQTHCPPLHNSTANSYAGSSVRARHRS